MTSDTLKSAVCFASDVLASGTVSDPAGSSRGAQSPARSSLRVLSEPRQLRRHLEDEVRSQGGNVKQVLKDAWVGKCTECPKYRCGICWANKKEVYNPLSPGKEGVCTLKRPDGTFKRARRTRS